MEIIILGENTCDSCGRRLRHIYGIKPRKNAPVALVLCYKCLFKLSKLIQLISGEKIKKEAKDD